MREGKRFDVSDVEAEMAAEKKKVKPEVASALQTVRELGQEASKEKAGWEAKLAEARKKIELAEGTEEIPLSEKDIEEVEDLTQEAEEMDETKN